LLKINDILKPKSEEEILKDISLNNQDPTKLLAHSATNNFFTGVKLALQQGANIHYNDDYALRLAAYNGHADVVKVLLDAGANVHANNDGALGWAAYYGHADVVKLLKHYMQK
jgi:ankyrin repeat protein